MTLDEVVTASVGRVDNPIVQFLDRADAAWKDEEIAEVIRRSRGLLWELLPHIPAILARPLRRWKIPAVIVETWSDPEVVFTSFSEAKVMVVAEAINKAKASVS